MEGVQDQEWDKESATEPCTNGKIQAMKSSTKEKRNSVPIV